MNTYLVSLTSLTELLNICSLSMTEQEAVAPAEPPPKEDFRQKQVHELEQLQIILDENNVIRQKFNALQTQVAPLVDSFAPAPVTAFQSERVYTPEEIEAMKQKLEQTLTDYREETRIAGRLNSEIERRYTELSNMKMRFRIEQDERLTRQNVMAAAGLANFRVKSVKVSEATNFEKDRLAKAVKFLRHIFDTCTQDIKEFDEQRKANNRGIQELTASISIAKDDIRDFTDQLQRIQPRLREYEIMRAEHQASEELVVQLGDEFDNLRRKVETESLTASIRRELDAGNRTIADLNRTIDQILNKTSVSQERITECRTRIAELEGKIARANAETRALRRIRPTLEAAKGHLKTDLENCHLTHETIGGENELLDREIKERLTYEREPWQVRQVLLSLKSDIRELGVIEAQQQRFEATIGKRPESLPALPPRKRLRLIPSEDPWQK
jgi:chromosome segregation ATPase